MNKKHINTQTDTGCPLSVVIPVYNTEKYLEECLCSLQAQSFQDYEVLLIDDGSTDRSPQICDAFTESDSRIRVIHTPNKGVSSARNLGIGYAEGKYICFFDSDDIFADVNVLRDMMRIANDHEADMIFAKKDDFFTGAVCKDYSEEFSFHHPVSLEEMLLFASKTLIPNNIYSRRLIGDLRFDTRLNIAEDILFLAQIIPRARNAVICERVFYNYRVHAESTAHSGYKKGTIENTELFYELLYKELHGKPGGDLLFEKNYADQTIMINKLLGEDSRYNREKRIVRKRILACFPHFLHNKCIGNRTKLFLIAYMISPNAFFKLFKPYKAIKTHCRSRMK